MRKKIALLLFLLTFICFFTFAQEGGKVSFDLTPGANIPLGSSTDRYSFGAGADLRGFYSLPFLPAANLLASLNYNLLQTAAEINLSTIGIGAGVGFNLTPFPLLTIQASADGGLLTAVYGSSIGLTGYLQAGGGLLFNLGPSFSLGLGANYKHYFAPGDPFYQGLGVYLRGRYNLGANRTLRPQMEIPNSNILPIFPVFYKYYDDNQIGSIVVKNGEKGQITDIRVSVFVKQYMASPKLSIVLPLMQPDEEIEVPLYAIFSDTILEITESTKVQADIIIEYIYKQQELVLTDTQTIRVHDRNAITWDDDRKAAAFVTSKDPSVLSFSKNVAGMARNRKTSALDQNILIAMGLHSALNELGITYVPDPSTPYIEFSQNKTAVDFCQFPVQTLQYKAGDCDDLSILYSALLESVGVETAFITVPAHLYMAFATNLTPRDVESQFSRPDDFIIREDKVWLPVEITSIDQGFLKAWQLGAKQWREYNPKSEAGFFPIHTSWEVYESVGFQGQYQADSLSDEMVVEVFERELEAFISREIQDRVAELEELIRDSSGNPKYLNRLGTLYARYGRIEEALVQFEKAGASNDYLPALVNLGNVLYMKEDFLGALEIYGQALEQKPDNPKLLMNAAKAYYEIEDYEKSQNFYERIKAIDPEYAADYEYLEKSTTTSERRAEAGNISVDWDEE